VEWNVEFRPEALTVPGIDPFDDGGSGLLSNFSPGMRTVIDAADIDPAPDTYYLFLLKTSKTAQLAGYMPRSKKFGFIFLDQAGSEQGVIHTIAHELGHGAFNLRHTFAEEKYTLPKSTTDNLMDYTATFGAKLYKHQWDQMRYPEIVMGVFEGDEAGASQSDPLLTQIKNRISELEQSTKLSFFAIVHCDACQNATSTSDTQIRFSELLDAPAGFSVKEKKITTNPETVLAKIQFIERPGGKCLVLYYSASSGSVVNGLGSYIADFGATQSTERKLFFLSGSNSTNCTSFIDTWNSGICALTGQNIFTESDQSKGYFNGLFDAINECLLNVPKAGKVLSEPEIETLLLKAKAQARSAQAIEFVQNGFVYRLNPQGKVELLANAPSNESINSGEWSEASIEMKMRLGYDPNGILQFFALGISKNLTLAGGKTADRAAVAQNMRDKNNALFVAAKITNVQATPKTNSAIINQDEFPDRKKMMFDTDASYLKIICELGGVGVSFLKTAKIEQPVYTEGEAYTIKAPPIVTGVLESVGMVVTDITSAAATIHDLATDKQTRQSAIDGLGKIKDQVVDDPTQLFPVLKEVALEELTGSSSDEFDEMKADNTNEGRRHHIMAKTGVRTASSVFSSGKVLVKLPEMAQKVAFKMAKSKSFLKFKKIPVPDEVLKDFEAKLKSLPDGGEKFLDDFKDVSDDTRRKILEDPEGLDKWKSLDEDGVDKSIRTNPDALENPDLTKESIEQSGKQKPTWPEIQALWKRGNDFNVKGRAKYGDDFVEVVLKGVDGKAGKRLDTYLPPSNGNPGQIISRKATTLSEIQPSTFRNYLNELLTKYPKGAELNSSKFPMGTRLDGNYKLEIPKSNESFFEASKEFQNVLSEFNTSKGVSIEIIYLIE
jgi:hypothetical protein